MHKRTHYPPGDPGIFGKPFRRRLIWALLRIACVSLMALGAFHANGVSVFNFDSDTAGTSVPFTDTVGGLSATFTGTGSVCNVSGLGFASLSGNALIQDFCNSEAVPNSISISFSADLASISFDFAIGGEPSTLSLTAFENGLAVGSSNFSSVVPPGHAFGEGVASFSGLFNKVTFSVAPPSVEMAIDNVTAAPVPEPGTLAIVGLACLPLAGWMRLRMRH